MIYNFFFNQDLFWGLIKQKFKAGESLDEGYIAFLMIEVGRLYNLAKIRNEKGKKVELFKLSIKIYAFLFLV